MAQDTQIRSSSIAVPCPTPTHMVASALSAFSRSIRARSVIAIRNPDEPSACPSAIAPPSLFTIPTSRPSRLLGALRAEALKLYDGGIAGFEDIDTAAKTALGHPMGPFELMDLVGLDVAYLIRHAHYQETGDAADLPHPALTKLYEAGHYGRKTGQGWYTYPE